MMGEEGRGINGAVLSDHASIPPTPHVAGRSEQGCRVEGSERVATFYHGIAGELESMNGGDCVAVKSGKTASAADPN